MRHQSAGLAGARHLRSAHGLTFLCCPAAQPALCARQLLQAPTADPSLLGYLEAQPSLSNLTAALQTTGLAGGGRGPRSPLARPRGAT